MKQWQNISAFRKVKTGLEFLVTDIDNALEILIDGQEKPADTPQKVAACAENLARISGILRSMEYNEFALLTDEMLALLHDVLQDVSYEADADKGQSIEDKARAWELLFIITTDLPAMLEGVLSGKVKKWHEYSILFNRVRKARSAGLIFSSDTLLNKYDVDFASLFSTKPDKLSVLLQQQVKLYGEAKLALQEEKAPAEQLEVLRSVFSNLAVLCRDYRLGTLWGLCLGLLDTVDSTAVEKEGGEATPTLKLLCSFTKVLQQVAKSPVKALSQGIPEQILEKTLECIAQSDVQTSRLSAIRLWYNLDLGFSKSQRNETRQLQVSYARKGAFIKAIKLLAEDINLLTNAINEEIATGERSKERLEEFRSNLGGIHGTVNTFGFLALAEEIETCLKKCDKELEQSSESRDAEQLLYEMAQCLYQSEISLSAKAEELDRAVFFSSAGDDSDALVGAKLNLVLEVIRNLELVIVAINHYTDSACDTRKLAGATHLLEEAEIALTTIGLSEASRFVAGAREFVSKIVGANKVFFIEETFHKFTHLLINTSLYLEQVTIGRGEDFSAILEESEDLLRGIESFTTDIFENAEPTNVVPFIKQPAEAEEGANAVPEGLDDQESPGFRPEYVIGDEATQALTTQADNSASEDKAEGKTEVQPEIDPEIKDIFIEEVAEVLETIDECLGKLKKDIADQEARVDLRRSFHTLKGSGRMVKAATMGELAWAVENTLNYALDGRIAFSEDLLGAVSEIREELPPLIDDFHAEKPCAFDVKHVEEQVAVVEAFLADQNQAETQKGEDVPAPEETEEADNSAGAAEAEKPEKEDNETANTDSDDLSELFTTESIRQVELIRELLGAPLDQNGAPVTTGNLQVPVHTLYGNCRVAGFQDEYEDLGQLIAPLERFIEDHPYSNLNTELKALFLEFCEIAELLIRQHGEQESTASEVAQSTSRIRDFLDKLKQLDNAASTVQEQEVPTDDTSTVSDIADAEEGASESAEQDGAIEPELDAEARAAKAAEEAALVLQAFLKEAKATNGQLQQLFASFKEDVTSIDLVARLKQQCGLLEGAASLSDQPAIEDMCLALYAAYQEYENFAFAMQDEILEVSERSHTYVTNALDALAQGKVAGSSAGLVAELNQAVAAGKSRKAEQNRQASEEQREDNLLEIFLEEATELLQELETRIVDWQQTPTDDEVIDEILRALHTLKGSAALVGEKEISEGAHDFETHIIEARRHKQLGAEGFFDKVDEQLEYLNAHYSLYRRDERGHISKLEVQQTQKQPDKPAPPEMQPLDQIEAVDTESLDQAEAVDSTEAPQPEVPSPEPGEPSQEEPVSSDNVTSPAPEPVSMGSRQPRKEKTMAPDEHVRVSGKLLKVLLNDADEINIARNRIEQNITEFNSLLSDMDETLGRLQGYIQNIEQHTKDTTDGEEQENEAAESDAYADEFDALEMDRYTELQQISLSLLEDYDDLRDIRNNLLSRIRGVDTILLEQQRSTNKLQDGLITSQLVPFAGIVPRLRRLARQISAELSKEVVIGFSNPDGKIDRSVLQTLVNPLEHLIRNAIDHGVESGEERRNQGKAAQASITVNLYRQGANIVLEISDDGRGIDVEAVKEKAVAKGLLAPEAKISDEEAYRFILQAGFSTSDTVSKISGRGIGLDVVYSEIIQIGGDLAIQSRRGEGTTFKIMFPLTTSLNRSLLFTVNDTNYVMLLNTIDGIMLESVETLSRHYADPEASHIEYANKEYELVYMGSMLKSGAKPKLDSIDNSSPLILVSGRDRNLAMQVDRIVGSRDLVVKTLGSQFVTVPGVTGGVILGDGEVVIVLDPMTLVEAYSNQSGPLVPAALEMERGDHNEEARKKTVLVVDDSITVRKVTSAILKRNGMNVIVAKNGMEAVEILQNTAPDIMLLDIEMPKMDGFELASYIRRHEELKHTPIIMITSRIGDKHRHRAEEIGVNQYMCKPFQEENLLEAIAGY